MLWFRKPPVQARSSELPQDVLRLIVSLSHAITENDNMLALLQAIKADLDTLKDELANQTAAIQANAAAKRHLATLPSLRGAKLIF